MDFGVRQSVAGILVLDKPVGISSRQALDRAARLVRRVKMGHAGTLDPLAAGVLVVCLGKATRLIPYVQRMSKEYLATLRLGQRSDTHDLEGEIRDVPFSDGVKRDRLEECLAKFRGEIMQVPPQHSAVHVRGQRAYELARAGRPVDLQARRVSIDCCVCTRFAFPEVDLEIQCSSGTYVRALVRDIGDDLGSGAVMTRLVRSAVGNFRQQDALSLDGLTRGELLASLRPVRDAVQDLPVCPVPACWHEDVRHGRPIKMASLGHTMPAGMECVLTTASGEALAVGAADATGCFIQPHIVLLAE
jgi:tRNA pseudouridine55 synthase